MSLTTVTKRHLLTATVLLATLALCAFNITQIDLTRQVRGLLPVANGGTAVSDFTLSGSTHKAATLSGSTTNAHCAQWDASSNITDAGTACASGSSFAWGGDGSDGPITANGSSTLACLGVPSSNTYLMTRDCFFTTLVVNSGVVIKTQQFVISASTSVDVSGTIQNSGTTNTAGGNGGNTGGAGSAGVQGGCCTNGNAGSLPLAANGGNGGPVNGVIGGAGGTTTGSPGTTGLNGNSASPAIAATYSAPANWASGAGGAGASGSGGASKNPGTGTGVTTSPSKPRVPPVALNFRDRISGTSLIYDSGPPGAPSGGGGGGDTTNSGGGGGGAGGSGGPGGYMVIASPTITVEASGVIAADGTAGGTGGNGGSPTLGNTGGGGGGAGGSGGNGGVIVLIYHAYTNNGSVHATAGSGGSGGTHGTAHGSGSSNGNDGATGPGGVAGLVITIAN